MGGRETSGSIPGGDAYIFPRHPSEIDRLDLQHFALREALRRNYLPPISTPAAVLDVGCGTGQWAAEVCEEFPDALVVGLDLQSSKSHHLPNYAFVKSNVLDGLPFADDRFDFVHQRLLGPGVPLKSWSAVVSELVRVARPAGWIELVEGRFSLEPAGPATARLFDLAWRLAGSLGLDMTGTIFRTLDQDLQRAGATHVRMQEVDIPVGDWGGRVGSFIASDFRAAFTRLSEVFAARSAVSTEECRDLLQTAQWEWEQEHAKWAVAYAVGRKPLP
jgi:SAM-dependent methyltransferase